MKKLITPIEWATLLGFTAALSILLFIGAMAILFLNQAKTDDLWVDHTHYVIEHLQSCLLAEREMSATARAYILTGQSEQLELYQTAVKRLVQSVKTVQALTTDNPAQQLRMTTKLRPLMDQRLSVFSRAIVARQLNGQSAAIAILLQNHALVLIDQIQKIIEEMSNEEKNLLHLRIMEHTQSSERLRLIILFGTASAIFFVVIAGIQVHHDVIARQRVEQDLRSSESRLKTQTRELQSMNKELESFSYSVSHDLRAPLRGIEGFSELILMNYKERLDAEGQGYFDRICAAAKRMGILIDEILNLSRITRSTLEMSDVDLTTMTKEIIEELRKSDPARPVHWIVQESLHVRGDPTLLNVVMTNLISNAWKFTGKKVEATIEIGKMNPSGEVVYFVRDNGAGFDMTYQSKLFQAFQRLHTPKEFPGTGIGLATVQRAVRRHGGRVWAEGQVDHGAAFFFTLS